jgi:acetyltransferase
MRIERLDALTTPAVIPQLAALLQDTVASGGSIGFLPPLSREDAFAYWHDVVAALETPYRILLVAREMDQITGTVQLDLASRPNADHRAEIIKLMVAPTHRKQGIGRALMDAIEAEATQAGRTTLVLDTRAGDPSERLYLSLGYTRAGTIPEYARSADGTLHSTVLLYKLLPKAQP